MRQNLTNSEWSTWRTCPKRHGFEYIDLLRPKVRAVILTWGNVIHSGLESGYKAAFDTSFPLDSNEMSRLERALEGGELGVRSAHEIYLAELDGAVGDGMPEEVAQERYEDAEKLLAVGLWAVPHFFKATANDLNKLVPLGFEVPFAAPVPDKLGRPTGLVLKGVIDALWWDPEMQRIQVDDHKTVDELVGTTEKRIALDPQMSGYLHGASHLVRLGQVTPMDGSLLPEDAWETTGACRYNCIRRSHPKQPGVNKVKKNDGPVEAEKGAAWPDITATLRDLEKQHEMPLGLVSAAAIDTTREIYTEALTKQVSERHLPITPEQQARLAHLEGQGDRYFARFEFWRNAQEREEWRREAWIDARRMREAERLPELRTRNPGACTAAGSMQCAFRAVCLDDEPETRALYRIAEKRHEEVG